MLRYLTLIFYSDCSVWRIFLTLLLAADVRWQDAVLDGLGHAFVRRLLDVRRFEWRYLCVGSSLLCGRSAGTPTCCYRPHQRRPLHPCAIARLSGECETTMLVFCKTAGIYLTVLWNDRYYDKNAFMQFISSSSSNDRPLREWTFGVKNE